MIRTLFVMLLLPVAALAQEKSAAPPAEAPAESVQAPTQPPAPSPAAPTAKAPAPSTAQQPAPGPAQGPPPKNLTKFPDGHVSANAEPKDLENHEIRVVVPGDTLWGVSADVLKDGKLWPQIWEQNEHIVNPHWIYPKDKILIRPITKITDAKPPEPAAETPAPAKEEPAPAPAQEPPPPPPQRRPYVVPPYPEPPPPPGPVTIVDLTPPRAFPEVKEADLYCSGFIRSDDVASDITITRRFGTNEVLASPGDYVYVSRGLDGGVRPGTTYQVVRRTRSVSGPGGTLSGPNLGTHYLEVARVEIVIGQADYALARVTQGCEAVELGDILIPFNRLDFPMLPSKRSFSPTMKASGQMPGSIVMTKTAVVNSGSTFGTRMSLPNTDSDSLKTLDRGLVAENGVVYLDVGTAAGAKPGDLFIVYRNAGLKDGSILDARGNETARIAIGEVVILKAEERASTALVTYSADAIALGDVVERR
jgi:hypothetical protein